MNTLTALNRSVCAACVALSSLALPAIALAQETPSGPGRDAPAGVMNSMLHREGEWMAGVRLMTMSTSGNRSGTNTLTDNDVYAAGYEQSPQSMTMIMPMLDIMYGVSDRVTVTATLPFVFSTMDMRMMDGETFDMSASGLADIRAGAMLGLYRGRHQDVHFYAGVQFPSGKVDARDDMPDCAGCKVDYPMQPGSGTFAITPGLTWVGESGDWSWGANWLSVFRQGTNSEHYTFGDRHEFSGWGVRRLGSGVSASVRLAATHWGDVEGADPDFDPMMSPTQDPMAQGGTRVDLAVGVALKPTAKALSRHRFAFEIAWPVSQDLHGPQLQASWGASASWQLWWN